MRAARSRPPFTNLFFVKEKYMTPVIITAIIAVAAFIASIFATNWLNQQHISRLMAEVDKRIDQNFSLTRDLIQSQLTSFDQIFNERIKALDQNFNERIKALDQSVNERIKALDQNFNKRLNSLDQKLSERINSLERSLNSRIDSLEQRMDARFDEVDRRFIQIEQRLKRLEEILFKPSIP
jgi:flagellar capping protein FliD